MTTATTITTTDTGSDQGADGGWAICHSNGGNYPWIAIDYGNTVTVQRVEIFNRRGCCGERTRNVEVRISDSLPTTDTQKFSGGTHFGHFAGPATTGQDIMIRGQTKNSHLIKLINISGDETSGKYVIVQMDNGGDDLNLKEVKAFGKNQVPTGEFTKLLSFDNTIYRFIDLINLIYRALCENCTGL